jgi:2-polyprenyl-6-methoxyphenol hydroxylase-like FAD-dependent oxidoreductase
LERRFGGSIVVFHRAELLALLADSVVFPNIHLGHELFDIDTNSPGVSVSFTNGATAHGDILIGADGLHSVVRRWLGHPDRIRYSGYTAWRAVVPFDYSTLVPAETWGTGRRFGAFPIILRNDIYDCDPLAEWGRGRVTLLGDAAHPMTPNLGQGTCQAMEDALDLAACLADVTSLKLGLEKYEKRRIARTGPIVLASRRLGRIAQIEDPLLCRLRDLVVQLTPNKVSYLGLAGIIGYEGHLS